MKKWTERTGEYTTLFGPIQAAVHRKWLLTPTPEAYIVTLTVAEDWLATTVIPMSNIPVAWHDDSADRHACRIAEKKIKELLKSWCK